MVIIYEKYMVYLIFFVLKVFVVFGECGKTQL